MHNARSYDPATDTVSEGFEGMAWQGKAPKVNWERLTELLDIELQRQWNKFGPRNALTGGNGLERRPVKLAILMEEVGELAESILKGHPIHGDFELLQVAAVAINWLSTGVCDDVAVFDRLAREVTHAENESHPSRTDR